MVVFSSVLLLLVSPVLLVSFILHRRMGTNRHGEHSPGNILLYPFLRGNILPYQFHNAVTTMRRFCYLLGLLPVVLCFISFIEYQGNGDSFYLSKLLSNVLTTQNNNNCVDIAARYTPNELIGIYGDMTGQFHRNVDTEHSLAQELFDQGLLHSYGFNTLEGIRNFRAAIKVDPNCAMCYWGIAYSNGPNINTDVTADMAIEGKESIQKAVAIMTLKNSKNSKNRENDKNEGSGVNNANGENGNNKGGDKINDDNKNAGNDKKSSISEANKVLIIAQEKEFSFSSIKEWTELTQKHFDLKYLEALKIASKTFPNDEDIIAMYAESIINLTPWQYYKKDDTLVYNQYNENNPNNGNNGNIIVKKKELTEDIKSAMAILKGIIEKVPLHPLALHLWIHVTEQSSKPSEGASAADSLAALAHNGTGTSHLLHMPAHIYLRTGRYHDAILSSRLAIASDRLYVQKCLVPYVPFHNIAMLVSASLYSGNFLEAMKYSPLSSSFISPAAAVHLPALFPSPIDIIMVRMGKWDDVIEIYRKEEVVNNEKNKKKEVDDNELRLMQESKESKENKEKEKNDIIGNKENKENKGNLNKRNRYLRAIETKDTAITATSTTSTTTTTATENNNNNNNKDNNNNVNIDNGLPPYVRTLQLYTQTLAHTAKKNTKKSKEFLDFLSGTVQNIPYDSLPCVHPFYPNHREIGEIFLRIARAAVLMQNSGNNGDSNGDNDEDKKVSNIGDNRIIEENNIVDSTERKIESSDNDNNSDGNNINNAITLLKQATGNKKENSIGDSNNNDKNDNNDSINQSITLQQLRKANSIDDIGITDNDSINQSITLLKEAIGIQDSFSYMEPESFYFPVRHCLGALLLKKSEVIGGINRRERGLQSGLNNGQSEVVGGLNSGDSRIERGLQSELESKVINESESELNINTLPENNDNILSSVPNAIPTESAENNGNIFLEESAESILYEAGSVYKTDLLAHPNNIWALRGLKNVYHSLLRMKAANKRYRRRLESIVVSENNVNSVGSGNNENSALRNENNLLNNENNVNTNNVDIEDSQINSNMNKSMTENEIIIAINELRITTKNAFLYTDVAYQNVMGSCCELSLC